MVALLTTGGVARCNHPSGKRQSSRKKRRKDNSYVQWLKVARAVVLVLPCSSLFMIPVTGLNGAGTV